VQAVVAHEGSGAVLWVGERAEVLALDAARRFDALAAFAQRTEETVYAFADAIGEVLANLAVQSTEFWVELLGSDTTFEFERTDVARLAAFLANQALSLAVLIELRGELVAKLPAEVEGLVQLGCLSGVVSIRKWKARTVV
jgi:hypothetical protein